MCPPHLLVPYLVPAGEAASALVPGDGVGGLAGHQAVEVQGAPVGQGVRGGLDADGVYHVLVWEPGRDGSQGVGASEGGAAPPSPSAGTLRHSQRVGLRRCWMVTRTEASWVPEPLTTRHTYSPESAGVIWGSRSLEPCTWEGGRAQSCAWGSQFRLPSLPPPPQPDRA